MLDASTCWWEHMGRWLVRLRILLVKQLLVEFQVSTENTTRGRDK